MRKAIFAVSFLCISSCTLFLVSVRTASAETFFSQEPSDDWSQDILRIGDFLSFGCTLNLNCGEEGKTIYNVGVWLKKVGSPQDISLYVVPSWNYDGNDTGPQSNPVSSNNISNTEFTFVWFHFPEGVVVGERSPEELFQFHFANTPWTTNPTDYYAVNVHAINDYSAPQQWCRYGRGCSSSKFYFKLDDTPSDLSKELLVSNVLFLPGIESSRLYKQKEDCSFNCEDQLWTPNIDSDVQDLYLDESGKSLDSSIYTHDVVDEAYGINIYKSFLSNLNDLKEDAVIADYSAAAYDWRLSLQDILNNGTRDGNKINFSESAEDPYILSELKRLSESSKTGKVTIIAHSNGGLVAKALVQKLAESNDPLLSKIDRIIFIAVPHLGTPMAIAAALHGHEQGIPLFLSEATAREFANNSPAAYNLLPSDTYFQSVDEPVVIFDEETLPDWVERYGNSIESAEELSNFLNDTYERVERNSRDVIQPVTLNTELLSQAESLHDVLDVWNPPETIEVIEIAGWGVETLSGIEYKKIPTCTESTILGRCKTYENKLTFNPRHTINGDKTVVSSSAASSRGATRRYWIDLNRYNESHSDLQHRDILEVPSLLEMLNSIILSEADFGFDYISMSEPVFNPVTPSLQFVLHSPLSLEFYDEKGNHAGYSMDNTRSNISGVVYERYGDVQWLFIPKDMEGHLVLHGLHSGSFTLDVSEVDGDEVIAKTSFVGIPSSTSTLVEMKVNEETSLPSKGILEIDFDGNGEVDTSLSAEENGEVTLPATSPLTVTANDQTILIGDLIPSITVTFNGFVNGETATSSDISGAPNCTTTATPLSGVGTYPIVCSVGTLSSKTYDFVTFVPGSLTIKYGWDGFLQPINDTTSQPRQTPSVFKGGSTVPVKFQLKKKDGTPIQATTAPLWLSPRREDQMSSSVGESVYLDPGTNGSVFKWDAVAQQYIYNWNTKGMASGYWYRINIKIDQDIYSIVVGLK